jgi:hypothetical protein
MGNSSYFAASYFTASYFGIGYFTALAVTPASLPGQAVQIVSAPGVSAPFALAGVIQSVTMSAPPGSALTLTVVMNS